VCSEGREVGHWRTEPLTVTGTPVGIQGRDNGFDQAGCRKIESYEKSLNFVTFLKIESAGPSEEMDVYDDSKRGVKNDSCSPK
jgi:hypothetical protein